MLFWMECYSSKYLDSEKINFKFIKKKSDFFALKKKLQNFLSFSHENIVKKEKLR